MQGLGRTRRYRWGLWFSPLLLPASFQPRRVAATNGNAGGMGEVWRARDLKLQRDAIRAERPELLDPQNIVQIRDRERRAVIA